MVIVGALPKLPKWNKGYHGVRDPRLASDFIKAEPLLWILEDGTCHLFSDLRSDFIYPNVRLAAIDNGVPVKNLRLHWGESVAQLMGIIDDSFGDHVYDAHNAIVRCRTRRVSAVKLVRHAVGEAMSGMGVERDTTVRLADAICNLRRPRLIRSLRNEFWDPYDAAHAETSL